jgi:hypothetical protein
MVWNSLSYTSNICDDDKVRHVVSVDMRTGDIYILNNTAHVV